MKPSMVLSFSLIVTAFIGYFIGYAFSHTYGIPGAVASLFISYLFGVGFAQVYIKSFK